MMIETLISMVRYLSARKDDDFADRMNYLYTPNMLLAFSVLISFKQFGGRPLECMFPNKFPGSWEQYAENYCWSEDTYYLPPEMHVAQVEETQRYSSERKLSYYQWVPFFLLLQAACFRLPSLIWKAISLSSGVRVHDIVTKAMDSQNVEELSRKRTLQVLAQHLARALRFQNQILRRNLFVDKTLSKGSCLNVTTSASFISVMYLLNKLLYLGNVLVQLYLMNKFLGTDRYQWYGLSVFADIMAGIPWTSSGYFPRVSLCDFTVRQVANIQKYSVQCVLVINIFTEKIFILLWFWYALLLVVTSISILYWALMMFFPQFGRWYIAQALELDQADLFKKAEEKQLLEAVQKKRLVRRFVDEFLRTDGVFTLRMLGIHAGILFTSELVSELYRIHEEVLQSSGESLTFSEDATLKLEDGTVVAASFVKAESPQKQNGHRDSLKHRKKRESERRHGSAPADVAETATALVPLVSEAGNRPSSSSSSSSESSRQNDDADDDNGRRNK